MNRAFKWLLGSLLGILLIPTVWFVGLILIENCFHERFCKACGDGFLYSREPRESLDAVFFGAPVSDDYLSHLIEKYPRFVHLMAAIGRHPQTSGEHLETLHRRFLPSLWLDRYYSDLVLRSLRENPNFSSEHRKTIEKCFGME